VRHYEKTGFPPPLLLNVNVPDIPYDELRGMAVTRLGKRHKAEPVIKSTTPRGETVYWVGAAGSAQDAGPGTDFYAVENQQVSITPMQIDLTQYKQLDAVQNWLGLRTETQASAKG
ncbi:MAG TPA: 5'/3'-nucleotidase SurE, partial [Methylophilaceae bacterium]|nr:5'/3'-nucleotidase SurE [Methylophilaceae bacterium]